MNPLVMILKIRNFILTNQFYLALATRVASYLLKLVPSTDLKIRLCDLYLRFNYNSDRSADILNLVLQLSGKRLNRSNRSEKETLIRSIIIKPFISENEKGVLLISFENQLQKIARLKELNLLEERYQLIFLPSWQPFYSTALYDFLSQIQKPFWIMPSSQRDAALCSTVGPLCLPMPFQASSWVDGNKYQTGNANKDIDVIMLANFSEYKRHWLLFEALSELHQNINIVITGRPLGLRNKDKLLSEAACFGVEGRFQIIENPSNEEIRALLGRSKMFCALSHKEGSYIGVVEAMFADVPVVMFENAIIGSKDFVNSETGTLIKEGEKLSEKIRFMLDNYKNFNAAAWARSNISAQVNCSKLNTILKAHSLSNGNDWTRDISTFYCENFDFYYYDACSIPNSEYVSVKDAFGLSIDIKKNLSD